MRKLLLHDLAVESFSTDDSSAALPATPIEPTGVTDGYECGKTLNTCPPQCNTYRPGNCV